jgi:hypothetical protein
MNNRLRNFLSILTGLLVGSMVNMTIIIVGGKIIPLPGGVDITKSEELINSVHLFKAVHFLFPFLAHAFGTFAGALVAAILSKTNFMINAIAIGIGFWVGGLISVMQIPAPMWFNGIDLVFAYLPPAFLAGKIISKRNQKNGKQKI